MIAIIGAAGNVGQSTSATLRKAGAPVRAILRDAAKGERFTALGCETAVANIQDVASLARALEGVDAVQVILPVAPREKDPAADLRRSIDSLSEALAKVRPNQILAISDYGAHVADDIGMPSVFRELESRLRGIARHTVILRSAEHMHNWGRGLAAALSSGTMMTFQDPVEQPMPNIAATDLGRIAAELLLRPEPSHGHEVIHTEGPRRYCAADVATALSELSGKTIRAQAVPRAHWKEAFERIMPPSLAALLIKANDAKNKGGLVDVEPNGEVRRGNTALIDALRLLVPAKPNA